MTHKTQLERAEAQQWAAMVQQLENLIDDIRGALGTEETGKNLVEVARAAHQAEQELAARIRRAEMRRDQRNADRIDGYDRDDLGESPDF